MSEKQPSQNDTLLSIPPNAILILAGVGLIIALIVAFTQATFTVVGWVGIAIAVLSIVGWSIIAPEQVRDGLTGRTTRYGGTAVVVTVVVLVALIGIYSLFRGLNIQSDITESSRYSLTQDVREMLIALGVDESRPPIEILVFLDASEASLRERVTLLLDAFQIESLGKVTYRTVDANREPLIAQEFGVVNGQMVVVALDEVEEFITESAEIIPIIDPATLREDVITTIVTVVTRGNYHVYFMEGADTLRVDDLTANGLTTLASSLVSLNFNITQLPLTTILADIQNIESDGTVIVLPGGQAELTDEEHALLTEYLDHGGAVVVFADIQAEGGATLAVDSPLADYIAKSFGIQVNNDLLIDEVQFFQSPLNVAVTDLPTEGFITRELPPQNTLIFGFTHSLSLAGTPDNVDVEVLAQTSENAFSKPSNVIQTIIDTQTVPSPEAGDAQGPFVVVASARNTETDARVVVFGSFVVPIDQYAQYENVENINVAFRSIVWASGFGERLTSLPPLVNQQFESERPLFADEGQIGAFNIIALLLPFVVLGIGGLVLWFNRERGVES